MILSWMGGPIFPEGNSGQRKLKKKKPNIWFSFIGRKLIALCKSFATEAIFEYIKTIAKFPPPEIRTSDRPFILQQVKEQ